MTHNIDVLCAGLAAYDLIFEMDHHPLPDEKCFASSLRSCGGGPAYNASVAAARVGLAAAFAGYLGNDVYGQAQFDQLEAEGVNTDYVVRGEQPGPLSAILVKPDGKRSVICFQDKSKKLAGEEIEFSLCTAKVVLLDGHQPGISDRLLELARKCGALTVVDAGSVHPGTSALAGTVDYVVASEKFAREFSGEGNREQALEKLGQTMKSVVITSGEEGIIWKHDGRTGHLPAFRVDVVDTTGAGDAFHGAFAAGLCMDMQWGELLRYSSAAAALNCTRYGASLGMPTCQEVEDFLERNSAQ